MEVPPEEIFECGWEHMSADKKKALKKKCANSVVIDNIALTC